MVAKQKNTNVVQGEAKTKPTNVLTYSVLELNYILFRKVIQSVRERKVDRARKMFDWDRRKSNRNNWKHDNPSSDG